jgi:phenylpropionate dioxygenase-like ring-hydroxylating dioxygenase large terminal subunit
MTLGISRSEDYLNLVDKSKGLVDRRIYHDRDIYEAELEHIFARAWNFMCHDSQIPNPGDFFMTFIGEDRVICVRDNDGNPQVLINSCRHRGNAVCRAEEGHATSFMCTYHGWTYDLQGRLVGVPGFKEVYHEELDRENWGLIRGRADDYKGWIFATLDMEAPPLHDFLGEVGRMGIDQMQARNDTVQVMGIQKWTIPANWKFAVDNVWDYYHAAITHSSSGMAGWRGGTIIKPGEMTAEQARRRGGNNYTSVLGRYGHTIGGPAVLPGTTPPNFGIVDHSWREKPESHALLGEVGLRANGHPNIFPNLWIMGGFSKASLRLPKGPTQTEIWWFAFANPESDEDKRRAQVRRQLRHDGPAGVFEQDDGENWGESTTGTKGLAMSKAPLHYAMNLGHGEIIDDESGPPHINTTNNEHSQLWFYHSWTKWMASDSWDDIERLSERPEGTM